jgi:DNA-binding MarR family transcriptional regulator
MDFTLHNLPRHQVIWEMAQHAPGVEASSVETYLLFLRVASDVFAALQTHLSRFDLSDGKLSVLLQLSTSTNGALTPSHLAKSIGIKRASVTDLLGGLERDRLVVRESSPEDGRMSIIRLSAQGRELLDELIPEHFQRLQALMSSLTTQDKQELTSLLEKISQNVSALRDP